MDDTRVICVDPSSICVVDFVKVLACWKPMVATRLCVFYKVRDKFKIALTIVVCGKDLMMSVQKGIDTLQEWMFNSSYCQFRGSTVGVWTRTGRPPIYHPEWHNIFDAEQNVYVIVNCNKHNEHIISTFVRTILHYADSYSKTREIDNLIDAFRAQLDLRYADEMAKRDAIEATRVAAGDSTNDHSSVETIDICVGSSVSVEMVASSE